MTGRLRTTGAGLFALMKAVIVIIGVPLALTKLWISLPALAQGTTFGGLTQVTMWARIVIICVAELWLIATFHLLRDVVAALSNKMGEATSWSSRWASAIVGLLLLSGASSTLVTNAGASPRPSVVVTTNIARDSARLSIEAPSALASTRALAWFGLEPLTIHALADRARDLRPDFVTPEDPTPSWEHTEELLAPFEGASLFAWIDATNRALGNVFQGNDDSTALPEVRLVRAGPGRIELLFDLPTPSPPWPFLARDGGEVWELDRTVTLDELEMRTTRCGRLLSCLVPLGTSGTTTVLMNLAPGRRLGLVGDPRRVRDVTAGMLIGLSVMPWCNNLKIDLVGLSPLALEDSFLPLQSSSTEALRSLAVGPSHTSRRQSGSESVVERIVVIDQHEHEQIESRLVDRIGQRVGMIAAGRSGTENLVVHDHRVVLEPFGVEIVPSAPNAAQLRHVKEALEVPREEPSAFLNAMSLRRH